MNVNIIKSVSMKKYERLLPKLFPGAAEIELCDRQGQVSWCCPLAEEPERSDAEEMPPEGPAAVWSEFCAGIERRQNSGGQVQFRAAVALREYGSVAWLRVAYDTQRSVPMLMSVQPIRRAFADAKMFLQEEIELQVECNQLATELSERYEELNLVYATKDQVEYFEEAQEALVRLVHNCADYLDVDLAVLICRERGLALHNTSNDASISDIEQLLTVLETSVYDHVEAQVQGIVLNASADDERVRLLAGRSENLLAYPVVDDYGTAIGLLAVVVRQDKHTFTNGDRNLLEVMAKKASRIVHTHHDSLTGLMNRSGFESSLIASLASTLSKNLQHCLLHINIDRLHVINDLMGFQEGDGLIRRVAKLIRNVLRDSDVVSRLGGGEFGVLLSNCDIEQGRSVAEKIGQAIRDLTVVSAKRTLDVSACIGIAKVNQSTDGIVGVMASAEIACKAAKDEGRDRVQVFEDDNSMLILRSKEIEWLGRVQDALHNDLFVLYCQPVLPLLNAAEPPHFELLIRMLDDDGKILAPIEFLPAAERYQLMPQIDRWVVQHTLKLLETSWSTIAAMDPVFCINLSGQSFANPGFKAFVVDGIRRSGVPPQNICFEVTETAAIANIDDAVAFMGELREFGCRFSLDDFGAGLSSFAYLKALPVDYLKIDGSFVREITNDKVSRSMVDAICQIGKTMQLSIVAEYVGDDETKEILRSIGVDFAQGFGIGKPVPVAEILATLVAETVVTSA